jgi:hypothetical protein
MFLDDLVPPRQSVSTAHIKLPDLPPLGVLTGGVIAEEVFANFRTAVATIRGRLG